MQLTDKHLVVTGAAQGIGYAIAQHLLRAGARVSLVDIKEQAVDAALASLAEFGQVHGYVADVADEDSVTKLFDTLKAEHGQLDALVNNAGILRDGLLVKPTPEGVKMLSLAQWQAVINVNLTGVFLCGRAAAAWMVSSGNAGVIINISSISRAGNIGQSNYSAAKAGVSALTVTWAKELARYGIRVADIAPGFIATEMTAAMKEEARTRASDMVPLKRWGQPDNIAQSVHFILTNDYFSGRTLEVDAALRF